MKLILATALWLVACGTSQPEPETRIVTPPRAVAAPVVAYDLHEWGLLSASSQGVELAAGPGRQAAAVELTVDKPVIYLHADGEVAVTIDVGIGDGYQLAEKWPGSGSQIVWDVVAQNRTCQTEMNLPDGCTSVDQYCEVRELPLYVANDSSCLTAEGEETPLLFYRLRATAADQIELPIQVTDGVIRTETARTAYRVKWTRTGTLVERLQVSSQALTLSEPTEQGSSTAARWISSELTRLGLTEAEAGAFRRAWWQALFRLDPAASADGDRVAIDSLSVDDEIDMPVLPQTGFFEPTGDVLLYFLTAEEINAIATIQASPAPRETHRAFLVRHAL